VKVANARYPSDPEHLRESDFFPKIVGQSAVMHDTSKGEPIARERTYSNVQEKLGAKTL